MTGSKIGKLEVLHEGPRVRGMKTFWVRCRCGAEVLRREYDLKRPGNKSCPDCKGCIKVLTSSKQKIVEDYYLWMIRKVKWNWVRNWPDLEDEILSAAHEGIIYAAFYFDEQTGGSFCRPCLSYVNKKIKSDMKKLFKMRGIENELLNRVRGLGRFLV